MDYYAVDRWSASLVHYRVINPRLSMMGPDLSNRLKDAWKMPNPLDAIVRTLSDYLVEDQPDPEELKLIAQGFLPQKERLKLKDYYTQYCALKGLSCPVDEEEWKDVPN